MNCGILLCKMGLYIYIGHRCLQVSFFFLPDTCFGAQWGSCLWSQRFSATNPKMHIQLQSKWRIKSIGRSSSEKSEGLKWPLDSFLDQCNIWHLQSAHPQWWPLPGPTSSTSREGMNGPHRGAIQSWLNTNGISRDEKNTPTQTKQLNSTGSKGGPLGIRWQAGKDPLKKEDKAAMPKAATCGAHVAA